MVEEFRRAPSSQVRCLTLATAQAGGLLEVGEGLVGAALEFEDQAQALVRLRVSGLKP